jgi:hypothetical protein
LATIERFLDAVIDRATNEDRGDEELMLDPVGSAESAKLDRTEWEPAVTLSHAIQRGLDYPRRGFAVYLKAREPSFERVILRFTTDDQLILGLSIDDTGGHPQTEARAREVLSELVADYDCYLGAILSERAPPRDERAFRALESQTGTVFFYAQA